MSKKKSSTSTKEKQISLKELLKNHGSKNN